MGARRASGSDTITRIAFFAAALLAFTGVASAQSARKAVVVLSPRGQVPPPPCRPAADLAAGELERLYRFASIPDGFARWKERDCFPPRLDDATLSRTVRPLGVVVSVGGKDAFVIDPGNNWLDECAKVGISMTGTRDLTGSDLLTVIDHITTDPVLSSADIREIGVAVGKSADGGGPVYALVLGTPRSIVRVQCFEDTAVLVERAAAAMRQAQPMAAR